MNPGGRAPDRSTAAARFRGARSALGDALHAQDDARRDRLERDGWPDVRVPGPEQCGEGLSLDAGELAPAVGAGQDRDLELGYVTADHAQEAYGYSRLEPKHAR